MDTQTITHRILAQRMARFPDPGPALAPLGTARFRHEGTRLRVAFATLAPGAAAAAVARVLSYTQSLGIGAQWVVTPQRPGEEDLPRALEAAYFYMAEDLLLMAREGALRVATHPAIGVAPIKTFQEMIEYEHGSRQAFFEGVQASEIVMMNRARDRWREQEHGWCRYYVARVEGRMAGGCYASLHEDVPTLMGVYTVPAARRRGVATALLVRAVSDTLRPGHEACCLYVRHGNRAEQLYRRVGFVPLLDEVTYAYEID